MIIKGDLQTEDNAPASDFPAWQDIVQTDGWSKADAVTRLTVFDNYVAEEKNRLDGLKEYNPEAYAKWQESKPEYDKWAADEREAVARSVGTLPQKVGSAAAGIFSGFSDAAHSIAATPFVTTEYLAGRLRDVAAAEEANNTLGLGAVFGLAKQLYGAAAAPAEATLGAIQDSKEDVSDYWASAKLGRPAGLTPWYEKVTEGVGGTTIGIAAAAVGGMPAMLGATFGMNYGSAPDTFKEFREDPKYKGMSDAQVKDLAMSYQFANAAVETGITYLGAKYMPTIENTVMKAVSKKATMTAGTKIADNVAAAEVFEVAEGTKATALAVKEATTDVASTSLLKNFFSANHVKGQVSEFAEEGVTTLGQWAVDRVYGRETDLAQAEWDTAVSSVLMTGLLTPGTRTEQGFNQDRARQTFRKYAESLLDGSNKEIAHYEAKAANPETIVEARTAGDRVEFLKDRAQWIKDQLGDKDVDEARATRYAAVLKTQFQIQEAQSKAFEGSGIREFAAATERGAKGMEDLGMPEAAKGMRELGRTTAEQKLSNLVSEFSSSDEGKDLTDKLIIAKYAPDPADVEFASPEERKKIASSIRSVLIANADAPVATLRELIAAKLAEPEAPAAPKVEANSVTPPTTDSVETGSKSVVDETPAPEPVADTPIVQEVAKLDDPAMKFPVEVAGTGDIVEYEGKRGTLTANEGRFDFTAEDGTVYDIPGGEMQPLVKWISKAPAAKEVSNNGEEGQKGGTEVLTPAAPPVLSDDPKMRDSAALHREAVDAKSDPVLATYENTPTEQLDGAAELAVRDAVDSAWKSYLAVDNMEGIRPDTKAANLRAIQTKFDRLAAIAERLPMSQQFTQEQKDDIAAKTQTFRATLASLSTEAEVDPGADVVADLKIAPALPSANAKALQKATRNNLEKKNEDLIAKTVEANQAVLDNPDSTNRERYVAKRSLAIIEEERQNFETEKASRAALAAELRAKSPEDKKAEPAPVKEVDRAAVFAEGAIDQLQQDFPEAAEMIEQNREKWAAEITKTAQRFVGRLKARLEDLGQKDGVRIAELEDQAYSLLTEEKGAQSQRARTTFYGILKQNFESTGNPLRVVASKDSLTPGAVVTWSSGGTVSNWTKADSKVTTSGPSLNDTGEDGKPAVPEKALAADEESAAVDPMEQLSDSVDVVTSRVITESLDSLAGFFANESGLTREEASKALRIAFRSLAGDAGFQQAMQGVLSKQFIDAAEKVGQKRATKASRAAEKYLTAHAPAFRKRFVEGLKSELPSLAAFARKNGIKLSERVTSNNEVTVADVILHGLAGVQAAQEVVDSGNFDAARSMATSMVYNDPAISHTLARLLDEVGVRNGDSVPASAMQEALSTDHPNASAVIKRLSQMEQEDQNEVLNNPELPESFRVLMQGIDRMTGTRAIEAIRNQGTEAQKLAAEAFNDVLVDGTDVELFNNIGLTPGRSQGLWWEKDMGRISVSPFLRGDLWGWTVLHETMHALTDYKLRLYADPSKRGLLTEQEVKAIEDLERLLDIANEAAQKEFAKAQADGMSDADLQNLRRDLFGTFDRTVTSIRLREFVTEAINHAPFRAFLDKLEDTAAPKDARFSVLRSLINKLLTLLRGGRTLSYTSVLQSTWENGFKLAGNKDRATADGRGRMEQQMELAASRLGSREAVDAAAQQKPGTEAAERDLNRLFRDFAIVQPFAPGAKGALRRVEADVLLGKRDLGDLDAQREVVALESAGPIGKALDLVADTKREAVKDEETFFKTVWPTLLNRTRAQLKEDPKNFNEAARRAIDDISQFLKDNPKFADYYNTDWKATIDTLGEHYGAPLTPEEIVVYRALAGLTSPATMLPGNIGDTVKLFDLWMRERTFDSVKLGVSAKGNRVVADSPVVVSGTTAPNKVFSIKILERLARDRGSYAAAVAYLKAPVTSKELQAFNTEMGYSSLVGDIGNIRSLVQQATGQSELIPRMFIFGQKVGAYTLNALGDHRFNTVDVWESRFIRSYFKGMFEQNTGLPVTTKEHNIFTRFTTAFAKQFEKVTGQKWENSALQAVRWFYMIDAAKKAGYSSASTNETISYYTKRSLSQLGRNDRGSREARDGGGRTGTQGRQDSGRLGDGGVRQSETSTQDLFRTISENPDGFTLDPETAEFVSKGWVVAPSKKTEFRIAKGDFTEATLGAYIDAMRPLIEAGAKIGGWLNKKDERFYLDAVHVVDNPKDAAILARDGQQLAVFHLDEFKEHDTTELLKREGISDGDEARPDLRAIQGKYDQGASGARILRTGDTGGSDSFDTSPLQSETTGGSGVREGVGGVAEGESRLGEGDGRPDLTELGFGKAPSDALEHRERFSSLLAAAADSRPNGEQVTKKTAEQLKGAALYTALDGKVGFAIYPTGEIGSFFAHADAGPEGSKLTGKALRYLKNNPIPGLYAVSFNTKLVPLYTSMGGFVPVARVAFDPADRPGWNYSNPEYAAFEGGMPSKVVYRLDPANAVKMTPAAVLAKFPQAVSYEEAVAIAKAPTFTSGVEAKAYEALTGEPAQVGFASASQAHDFISDNFWQAVSDVGGGLDLVANYTGHVARYVVSGPNGGNYIEFNPVKLAARTREQVRAVMRQELVHAASGAALAARNPGMSLEQAWVNFYTDLDNSLTPAQKKGVATVYGSTESGHARAAEFFRMALEKLHYGTITEEEMRSTAMQKILKLLKDVLDFFTGKSVSTEVRAIFDDTAAILRRVDPQTGIPAAPEVLQSENSSNETGPAMSKTSATAGANYGNPDTTTEVPFIYTSGRDRAREARGAGSVRRVTAATANDLGGSKSTGTPDQQRAGGLRALIDYAEENGLRIAAPFFRRLANADTEFADGGAEHSVYFDPKSGRVIKLTHDDIIGDGTVGVRGSAGEYFTSLLLSRAVFGMDTRFEGIVDLGGASPQVVTSQPMVKGRKATNSEIAKELRRLGFEKKGAKKDVNIWENKELGVDVYDAVPSNVLRDSDGVLHFIDVDTIPKRPVSEILAALGTDENGDQAAPMQSEPARLDANGLEVFENPYVPEFRPTLFTEDSRKVTTALSRVLSAPGSERLRDAIRGKRYVSYTVDETTRQAAEYIDLVKNGDLIAAFEGARTEWGMPAEQIVTTQGLVLKRAVAAAKEARDLVPTAPNAQAAADLETLAEHYEDLAARFGPELMERLSLAGQELRAGRILADMFGPANWVRAYRNPIAKAQLTKLGKEKLPKEVLARIRAARREAANGTTARMVKVLEAVAGRGFKQTGATPEEIAASQELARQLASPLPVREQVVQAAVEEAVIAGLQPVLDSMSDDQQNSAEGRSFLNVWKNRLRDTATKQLEAWIAERLKGGQVVTNDTSAPKPTPEEQEAAYEQKINEVWGLLGDMPLAQITFELARATIAVSDTPFAGIVKGAKFDTMKADAVRRAVKMSVVLSREIRSSVGDRQRTKDALRHRLRVANPNLTDDQALAISDAVESVYNEEVQAAATKALQNLAKQAGQEARRVIDQPTIDRILPIINLGVFSNEEVYNALAPKYDLPVWNKETSAALEAEAMALQELAEGSVQRGEAGQKLIQSILKATTEAGGSGSKVTHYANVAGALWTAGILSRPQTQMVNASATAVSVFMEAVAEARGYQKAALAEGATPEQAAEFYKDIMRAFRFSFGKDASNTSLRVLLEAERALTKGTTHHKSTKGENLQLLELYDLHKRVSEAGGSMLEAMASGDWSKAAKEFGNTVGATATTMVQRVAERDLKGAATDYMASAKFVGRVMLATDAINAGAARNMKLFMERRYLALTDKRLADRENLSEVEIAEVEKEIQQQLDAANAEILPNIRDNAIAMADDEAARGEFGPAGTREFAVQRARRIEQLVEFQSYGEETLQKADNFASEATFNGDAYGLVGLVMNGVFGSDMRQKFGPYGVLMTPINPFPRTASNLINQALNYSPYGFLRAHGANLGSRLGPDNKYFRGAPGYGSPEFHALQAKATAGTVALGTIGGLVALAIKAAWDDKDEKKGPFWFALHGNGPKDPVLRKQWMAAGNKPYTVRVGGATMKYNDIPGINLVLGALGTLHDQMVWGKKEFDRKDPMSAVSSVLLSVIGTTMNRQMLGGMSSLFDVISNNTTDAARQAAFSRLLASYATGFTNPGLFRAFESAATGETYETRTWEGWALQFVPMGQAISGRERYNILGEPIKKSLYETLFDRMLPVIPTKHPVLTPLTEAGLRIPLPRRYGVVGSDGSPREMSESEFYDYGKAYGDRLSAVLTPAQVAQIVATARTNPESAQDRIDRIALSARNSAQSQLRASRGVARNRKNL